MSMLRTLPALALLLSAATSFAATQSILLPISYTALGTNANAHPFATPIPQFNSSLGTLTGATIEITIPTLTEYVNVSAGQTVSFTPNGVVVTNVYGVPYSETVSGASINLTQPSATDLTLSGGFQFFGAPSVSATVPTTPYIGTSPLDSSVVVIDTYSLPTLDSTFNVTSGELSQLVGSGTLAAPFSVNATGILDLVSGVNFGFGLGSFAGTETVTYTYTPSALLGDANSDGKVDLSDLNIVLNHLGETDGLLGDGNFDGAATIDLTDLNDVLNNLGVSSPNDAAAALVPEPTSLSILAAGLLFAARRRPRR